jgi:hypothetical protein
MKLIQILLENSTIDWYHGSNSSFNKFDLSNFGKTDEGWWGIGIYFHTEIETAKAYGRNVISAKFNTNKILELPVEYSGKFLYSKLKELGMDLDEELIDTSAMYIIRTIGKDQFTNIVRKVYDVMIINYAEGTKEAVVFNPEVIQIIQN